MTAAQRAFGVRPHAKPRSYGDGKHMEFADMRAHAVGVASHRGWIRSQLAPGWERVRQVEAALAQKPGDRTLRSELARARTEVLTLEMGLDGGDTG